MIFPKGTLEGRKVNGTVWEHLEILTKNKKHLKDFRLCQNWSCSSHLLETFRLFCGFVFLPVENFSILNLCRLPQETVPRSFNEHECKECCPICPFEIKWANLRKVFPFRAEGKHRSVPDPTETLKRKKYFVAVWVYLRWKGSRIAELAKC